MKYPTMAEIRQCLNDGGHIAVTSEGAYHQHANLVWPHGKTQRMPISTVRRLYSIGRIDYFNSRKSAKWSVDFLGPGPNW